MSTLIALSKIYEKAVSVQLADYFGHIFSSLLPAFRKGYSCQSTLLNMIENFKCALDRGEYIACISMDISKACGYLPHCLTICKLHAYGLSRNACTLIASYMYQRKQLVKIGNIRNSWKETNKGVPKGSILEPLIFNIFMNDLFYFVKHANLFNYADDKSVSVSGKELNTVSLISVLSNVAKIFERNVHEQIVNYLEHHCFITPYQSAYLKKHSTVTCLHRVIDDMCENIDDRLVCGVCFLDIEKCFDTIDHDILLQKLRWYGINGHELDW